MRSTFRMVLQAVTMLLRMHMKWKVQWGKKNIISYLYNIFSKLDYSNDNAKLNGNASESCKL